MFGDLQIVHMDSLADSAHARFVASLREDLDSLVPGVRRAILYDVTERVRISAAQTQQVARLFRDREQALRRAISGYALVTPSTLVRGILATMFWVAPPPYPYVVEATLSAGLEFLAAQQPSIAPAKVLASYEALKSRLGF